jgi:predicted adenylyl cyclase CyaB
MFKQQYEIEIKSLLGNREAADNFRTKMKEIDPLAELLSRHSQINHYFIGGDVLRLFENILKHIPEEMRGAFKKNVTEGKNHSIRTRKMDDMLLLVLKSSIDDATSDNAVSRMEFECEMPHFSHDELDNILFDSGFLYQAKWSRIREEYRALGMNICIDKNAGYGYLAEIEMVVDDESAVGKAKAQIYDFMQKAGIDELCQERLERMFAHYNANWQEYFGTDKVFVIE